LNTPLRLVRPLAQALAKVEVETWAVVVAVAENTMPQTEIVLGCTITTVFGAAAGGEGWNTAGTPATNVEVVDATVACAH